MEQIKNLKDLPFHLPCISGAGNLYGDEHLIHDDHDENNENDESEWELTEKEEKKRLSYFNSGQIHLAEEVAFALEQIQISISLNDGNFCNLLDELQENINQLLRSGQAQHPESTS